MNPRLYKTVTIARTIEVGYSIFHFHRWQSSSGAGSTTVDRPLCHSVSRSILGRLDKTGPGGIASRHNIFSNPRPHRQDVGVGSVPVHGSGKYQSPSLRVYISQPGMSLFRPPPARDRCSNFISHPFVRIATGPPVRNPRSPGNQESALMIPPISFGPFQLEATSRDKRGGLGNVRFLTSI